MNEQKNEQLEAVEMTAEKETENSPAKAKKDRKNKEKRGDGRRFRYGTAATVLTVCVVVAAVLLNVLVDRVETRFPLTLDLTDNGLLTLSDESVALAKSIKSDVKITVCYDEKHFTSPNTGYPEIDNVCRQFYSALQRYQSLSGGKVTFEFVDLTAEPIKAAELAAYNVASGNILFVCGERHALTTLDDLYEYDENYQYYMAGYGGSDYQFDSLVEKVMAVNINKVTNGALTEVTMLTGHGEDEKVVAALTALLQSNGYEVLTLDITTMDTFDEHSTMAILPAPTTDYTADELKTLRTWVENGGKYDHQLTYIVDYYHFLPNLSEYFNDNYGIEVTSDWVVETSPARLFQYYTQYIYGDVATTEYTSADDKWVKAPLSFRLITHWDEDSEQSKYNQSVVTFPESAELVDLNAYLAYEEAAKAAESSDADTADIEAPQQKKADKYPITGMAYSVTKKTVDGQTVQSNALVCSSSGYFSLFLSDAATSNEKTFLSVFNGLVGNEDAIVISNKSVAAETVDFGSDALKKGLGLGVFTIGVPLILLIVGIAVFLRRKNL